MAKVLTPDLDRVKESYKRLSEVATSLNSVSDKLGTSINNLESAIRALSLGVSSWVSFNEWQSDDAFRFTSDDIGFAKIGTKWGFGIRSVVGNEAQGFTKMDVWPFNEAARILRVQAIPKIPELLEQLIKDAIGIEASISEQIETVEALTKAIVPAIEPKTEGSLFGKRLLEALASEVDAGAGENVAIAQMLTRSAEAKPKAPR